MLRAWRTSPCGAAMYIHTRSSGAKKKLMVYSCRKNLRLRQQDIYIFCMYEFWMVILFFFRVVDRVLLYTAISKGVAIIYSIFLVPSTVAIGLHCP